MDRVGRGLAVPRSAVACETLVDFVLLTRRLSTSVDRWTCQDRLTRGPKWTRDINILVSRWQSASTTTWTQPVTGPGLHWP